MPFPNTIKYIFVLKEGINLGSWFRLKNTVLTEDGALQLAEIFRVRRLKREEQHRRWEEEWRQRELREEARKKEGAKERAFRAEVRKWHLRRMMREYICERERAMDNATLEPEPKQRAVEWIAWAKQCVERIDPLNRGFEIRNARESEPSWSDEDAEENS